MSSAGVERVIYIDAENLILGRLASQVAKALLEGYTVYVFNIEKAVESGDPKMVKDSYKIWLELKTLRNPQKQSPKRPRTPEAIFKRAVKGMLPKNWKGVKALKRLKVFVGVPPEFKNKNMIKLENASADRLSGYRVSVAEIARSLGWKG